MSSQYVGLALPFSRSNRCSKYWTGLFWKRSSLFKLRPDSLFQLGHSNGVCALPSETTHRLVVLHSNGVHEIRTRYCNCVASSGDEKRLQLLRQRWYPATVINPQTCATFQVLDLYEKLFLVGGMNVHAFIGTLENLTSCLRFDDVPVWISSH